MLRVLLFAASLLLLMDPYTFGRMGGDEHAFTRVYWQSAVAGISFGLLVAVTLWLSSHVRSATRAAVAELAVFAVANVIYIARDGFDARMYAGYEGSPIPLATFVVGILIRGVALFLLFRNLRGQHHIIPASSS